jgi:hypothetical protein
MPVALISGQGQPGSPAQTNAACAPPAAQTASDIFLSRQSVAKTGVNGLNAGILIETNGESAGR